MNNVKSTIKEDPIVVARYDMDEAFREEVEYAMANLEQHADLFEDHEKLSVLAEKHLPDDPEEFIEWARKFILYDEVKTLVEKMVADWEYGIEEHEMCLQSIDQWLHDVKGPYIAIGLNHSWRNLTGYALLDRDVDSGVFWEKMTPDSGDLTFKMSGYSDYAKIKIWHHDSPMGETTYIRPIKVYINKHMTYHEMLKIIKEQKQELNYWDAYPDKFNKENVLHCVSVAIGEHMIPWEWPMEWFNKEVA